jgi:hypothetical protein
MCETGTSFICTFSDPIIPLVILLEIACWIGSDQKNLRSGAYFPEWKLALTWPREFLFMPKIFLKQMFALKPYYKVSGNIETWSAINKI